LPADNLVVRVMLELVSIITDDSGLLVGLVFDGNAARQGAMPDAINTDK
jgi:hypothetical protein